MAGLRSTPKHFPSKYLYDAHGAALFEQICEQPEYYPTRTEAGILREKAGEIRAALGPQARILEPGSGEGIKTQILLEALETPHTYVPVDIAKEQLAVAAASLNERFPDLRVRPICADFTQSFDLPDAEGARSTSVFFPGSTIGNFLPPVGVRLLASLARFCSADGGILVGVDLQKPREALEAAYDDAAGVSADFALNILTRYNRELDADFDLDAFRYDAPYNASEGRIEMGLISQRDQTCRVAGASFDIARGEKIFTEYSYKFTVPGFADFAREAGLQVTHVWWDPEQRFSLQFLQKRSG